VTKLEVESGAVESECGKCYLGDAFRCASCPFKGLPAFEKGDKVKIMNNMSNQQDQVPQQSVEAIVQQENTTGKVVLDTGDESDNVFNLVVVHHDVKEL